MVYEIDENTLILKDTTTKLLYGIYKELQGIRKDLKQGNVIVPKEEKNNLKSNYTSMKRTELMKLIKPLENKPKNWAKLSNEKLIELLKG